MTLIVTWLWQGLAIAWITAAAVRTMPRLNAATRHAIWWLALAAVLVIPVAHELAAITAATPPLGELSPLGAAGALVLPAIPGGIAAGAAAVWAMTAVFSLLRIARSCRDLGRLKRASSRFDGSREARLPLWTASRHCGHRAGELRVSDSITGACVLGFGRPAILVSSAVADALSDESLDEIVMHEQAHLDRYDDWSQLLLASVGSLAGLHPAVRFLARRIDIDREAACDDRVVSRTGAARRYAASLLKAAAASNPAGGGVEFAAAVPTATTTASALRVRVGRLLDPHRDRGARLARATSLASVTALALAVFMSTQAAPAVVFLDVADVNVNPPAAAPEIDTRRAPEPARITSVDVPARMTDRAPRRRLTRVEPLTQPAPPAAAAPSLEGPPPEPPPPMPLDSRTMTTNVKASPIAVSSPSGQLAVLAPAPAQGAPWDAVRTSSASAAGDVARAAAATGARARNAGVSIARFVTRASKAGSNVF